MRAIILTLVLSFVSLSASATDFKQLPWKEFGTFALRHHADTAIDMKGAKGMYVRFFVPDACGYVSFGVSAVGKPFDPRMVYADNYFTPLGRTLYFFVGEEKEIAFDTIWMQHGKIDKGRDCPVTLSLASVPNSCGKGDTVFAQGQAYSPVGAHVAKELAWRRTVELARQKCSGLNICKVPGKSTCSGHAHGNHWRYECNGWFVCETNQP